MVAQTALDLALFSANKVPIKTAKWCFLVHFNASLCIMILPEDPLSMSSFWFYREWVGRDSNPQPTP